MLLRLALWLVASAAVAGSDLVVKALVAAPPWAFHERSPAFAAASLCLVLVAAALCAVPSRFVAVAAGLVTGGVAGNLVSAAAHAGRVPNVVVLGRLAFTPADVALVAGAVLLTAALARAAIIHRGFIDRHVPPRAWERGLRRRLGL